MKITKTASGKKSVKISKMEWLAIGKKAGWMRNAFTKEAGFVQTLKNFFGLGEKAQPVAPGQSPNKYEEQPLKVGVSQVIDGIKIDNFTSNFEGRLSCNGFVHPHGSEALPFEAQFNYSFNFARFAQQNNLQEIDNNFVLQTLKTNMKSFKIVVNGTDARQIDPALNTHLYQRIWDSKGFSSSQQLSSLLNKTVQYVNRALVQNEKYRQKDLSKQQALETKRQNTQQAFV